MVDDSEYLPPPHFYKKEAIEVSSDDPWKNDKLDRKKHADKLWNIIKDIAQPMVMTVSAPYGMGKSTFIDCWKADLEKNEVDCVKFNAWESDFAEDAFSAFVASIYDQLKDSEVKANFISSAKKLGSAIAKNSPKFLARSIVKLLAGEKTASELENYDLNEDDLAEIAGDIANDSFKFHAELSNSVITFRDEFERLIEKKCRGKLLIFVDELDRCRPTYAVEILERIKHIFGVKGAIFVLAVDRAQLLNSFSSVYGAALDSERYSRKFVDWHYELPEPQREIYSRFLYYEIFEFDRQGFFSEGEPDKFPSGVSCFFGCTSMLFRALDFSLRDIDQYFSYLNLVFQNNSAGYFRLALALVVLLKCENRGTYREIISGISKDTEQENLENSIENILENILPVTYENSRFVMQIIVIFSIHKKWNSNVEPKLCVSKEFFTKVTESDLDNESLRNRALKLISGEVASHTMSWPEAMVALKDIEF